MMMMSLCGRRVGSVVWACILIFVWLRGKIRVGEWCREVVGSCEVQQDCEVRFLRCCIECTAV